MMDNYRELAWDDAITEEGTAFTLLPEGDYEFTVAKVERARHSGSANIPACNMAKVTFTVWGANDKADITENFYLYNKFEWKLSALFLSIGQKRHGEPLRMNWSAVTGARGKCRVVVDTYHKKDDKEGENTGKCNRIKRFYAYDEQVTTVSPPPATNQTPTAHGGWTPGEF